MAILVHLVKVAKHTRNWDALSTPLFAQHHPLRARFELVSLKGGRNNLVVACRADHWPHWTDGRLFCRRGRRGEKWRRDRRTLV